MLPNQYATIIDLLEKIEAKANLLEHKLYEIERNLENGQYLRQPKAKSRRPHSTGK